MSTDRAAEPVAWRITDGEGGYNYREKPPTEFNLQWAGQYNRHYVPLYTRPPEPARDAEWQPIETAPKDGTVFLGCMAHRYHPQEAVWAAYHPNAKGKECWRTSPICGNKIEGLTHWMPRPAPPTQEPQA